MDPPNRSDREHAGEQTRSKSSWLTSWKSDGKYEPFALAPPPLKMLMEFVYSRICGVGKGDLEIISRIQVCSS